MISRYKFWIPGVKLLTMLSHRKTIFLPISCNFDPSLFRVSRSHNYLVGVERVDCLYD